MRRIGYIILILIGFTNCSKNKCELPLNYSNIDKPPSDDEMTGRYKVLNSNSDFRIVIDKLEYRKTVTLKGHAPWCIDSTYFDLKGEWNIVSNTMNHFDNKEFGFMFQLSKQNNMSEGAMGLGQFLIKKLNGKFCIILPIDKNIKDCYQRLSYYSMSCDFITFEKE